MNGNRYLPILNSWLSGLITEENYKAPSEYMIDCKQLTQYLINENSYVDSTNFCSEVNKLDYFYSVN